MQRGPPPTFGGRLAIGSCPCQSAALERASRQSKPFPAPRLLIAVDGPAASGKGTIARALAKHFGLPHMDTGLLYRAVALNLWRWGGDPANEFEALARLRRRSRRPDRSRNCGAKRCRASRRGSRPIRRCAQRLLERQREFAGQPGGAVLDGRDIGTVIAPDADAKLFVTASAEVRARRRVRELLERGMPAHFDEVLTDIRGRDERDTGRDIAPLAQAEDADLLDTSDLDIDEAIAAAIALVEKRVGRR